MPTALKHLIFLYGTLQRGENNYPYWIADEAEVVFVARGQTTRRYPFFVTLLPRHGECSPCVLDLPDCAAPGCGQVQGELFCVSDKVKAWIEVLEGVENGTYLPLPTTVKLLDHPSASSMQRGFLCENGLWPTTHLLDGETSALTVQAVMYFRSKGYPADWASPNPHSSSHLLQKFSAASMLEEYGARFNGGLPAHLRRDGHITGEAMQKQLNALPREYWPPSTLAYMEAANATTTSQSCDSSEGLSSCVSWYGAPLFPKPMVLFIIDGVGDNTYVELGRRTPLEVVAGVPLSSPQTEASPVSLAVTQEVFPSVESMIDVSLATNGFVSPGINVVSRHGLNGLMDPYLAGKSCGSDTAHLSMFGYPPPVYYRGRGAYEALGAGLLLDDEDVAFKSNFATFADPAEGGFGDEDPAAELQAQSVESGERFVTHRRCDRDFTVEGPVLCAALNGMTVSCDLQGIPFDYPHVIKLQYATEHRCGVALSGAKTVSTGADGGTKVIGMLSDKITGTDPLKDGRLLRHCLPTVDEHHPEYAAAVYTCRLVEAASAALTERLKVHPVNESRRKRNRELATQRDGDASAVERKNVANLILFRGAAKKGWVPEFAVRHGLHGVIIAPTCIIKGLGVCCGLSTDICSICDPDGSSSLRGATGDYHSDLMVKVRAALHALRLRCPPYHMKGLTADFPSAMPVELADMEANPRYNFVVVHVKGVDDAGHDKSLSQKLEMLRRCGEAMQFLWDELPVGATVAVVADHSTPLEIGDHCCEPVPVAIGKKLTAFNTITDGAASSSSSDGCVTPFLCDGVQYYSEVLAQDGALGRFRGEELIPLLKRVHHHYHYQ